MHREGRTEVRQYTKESHAHARGSAICPRLPKVMDQHTHISVRSAKGRLRKDLFLPTSSSCSSYSSSWEYIHLLAFL